jgi:co-chaperonin GroES (HSP10)
MVYRVLAVLLVAVAMAMFSGSLVLADEQKGETHEGTVVSVTDGKLVMKTQAKVGEEAMEHTHKLADNAKVTCDGKACKLDDLKPGQKIRVTTKKGDKETAIKIEALDKNTKFGRDQ